MSLIEEITQLKDKAVKYDNMHERYVEHGKKLQEIIEELQELLKQIDPAIELGKAARGKKKDYSEMVEELTRVITGGTEVSREFIQKAYPNLIDHDALYVMSLLRKNSNIQGIKRGRTLYLFAKKNY